MSSVLVVLADEAPEIVPNVDPGFAEIDLNCPGFSGDPVTWAQPPASADRGWGEHGGGVRYGSDGWVVEPKLLHAIRGMFRSHTCFDGAKFYATRGWQLREYLSSPNC